MYLIVLSKLTESIATFEMKVTKFIKSGYTPCGSFQIFNGYYMQAVYKYKE